ncbi:MAG: adenine deaminase, partial [Nitrospinota bacterium]
MAQPAELVIRRCRFVNVATDEIYPADIEISGGRITQVCPAGQGRGRRALDARGLYATPGFMDAHLHTESCLLTLSQFAAAVLPAGTTTVFVNPHEIANVLGLRGVRWMLREAAELPLRIYLIAPCKVPTGAGLETSGAKFGRKEIDEMATWPDVVAMGEFNADRLVAGEPRHIRLLRWTRKLGKMAAGHAPGTLGADLVRLRRMGVLDDHESETFEEVRERSRVGITSFLREGSAARSLEAIIPALVRSGMSTNRLCFCTDDKHADDLLKEGGIGHCVRKAIKLGLPPVSALAMASRNCARHYGLEGRVGSLLPGEKADLLLMPSLRTIQPRYVLVGGRVVCGPNASYKPPREISPPAWCTRTVRIPRNLPRDALKISAPRSAHREIRSRIIGVAPDSILKKELHLKVRVQNGALASDPANDVLKIAVMDRYTGKGKTASAFVRGFGLREGALVSSIAHDHHNLIGVGVLDEDIIEGFRILGEGGGGLCAVRKGKSLALLPLPLAGLLSDLPLREVVEGLGRLDRAARRLGCRLPSPFMTLSFISLVTIP